MRHPKRKRGGRVSPPGLSDPQTSSALAAPAGLLRRDARGGLLARVLARVVERIRETGSTVHGALGPCPVRPPVRSPAPEASPEQDRVSIASFDVPIHDNDGLAFGDAVLAGVLFDVWALTRGLSILEQVGFWQDRQTLDSYIDASFRIEIWTRSPAALEELVARIATTLGQEWVVLRLMGDATFRWIPGAKSLPDGSA